MIDRGGVVVCNLFFHFQSRGLTFRKSMIYLFKLSVETRQRQIVDVVAEEYG